MDTAAELELGLELEQKPAAGYWSVVGARPCDACAAEPARLHCRADGAFLCPGCDARAHGAGSRHARVWLCEVCEHAPAAVTCRADAAALCAACDADIHDANPLARRHERVPVQPIGAAADPAAEKAALLFGLAAEGKDGGDAAKVVVDASKLDLLFADDVVDPFLAQDFARFPHADSVVPNDGSNCGAAVDFDFGGGVAVAAKQPSYSSYTAASLGHSVSVPF